MKKKWIKRALWIFVSPILLVWIIGALLYVPPIQSLLVKKITAYASEATNLTISINRVRLKFPLDLQIKEVEVLQHKNKLLQLKTVSVRVHPLPLLKGRVDVDHVILEQALIDTHEYVEDLKIAGTIGYLNLVSHNIDLSNSNATINQFELKDADISVINSAQTTEENSETTPWNITLEKLNVQNINVAYTDLTDSLQIGGGIGTASLDHLEVNLKEEHYQARKFLLNKGKLLFSQKEKPKKKGFDSQYIELRDFDINLESATFSKEVLLADLKELTVSERSGVHIENITAKIQKRGEEIDIPYFKIQTPHSDFHLSCHVPKTAQKDNYENLFLKISSHLGKQDLFNFLGDLSPDHLATDYPNYPIFIDIDASGDNEAIFVNRLDTKLPSAFSIKGYGKLSHLTDSLQREAVLTLKSNTEALDFLLPTDSVENKELLIPEALNLLITSSWKKNEIHAKALIEKENSRLHFNAQYNTFNEAYQYALSLASIHPTDFLPTLGVETLSGTIHAKGIGLNPMGPKSTAQVAVQIDSIQYDRRLLTDISLNSKIKHKVVDLDLISNNKILDLDLQAKLNMQPTYPLGKASIHVRNIDLYRLHLIEAPLKREIVFTTSLTSNPKDFSFSMEGEGMHVQLASTQGVASAVKEIEQYASLLQEQVEARRFDHNELRKSLPYSDLNINIDSKSFVKDLLKLNKIGFTSLTSAITTSPLTGANGDLKIENFSRDSLKIDEISLNLQQDTTQFSSVVAVHNKQTNRYPLKASFTSSIKESEANFLLDLENGKKEKGILIGVNLTPDPAGVQFKLFPEKPILAFKEFKLNEGQNWLYLYNNLKLLADIEMLDSDGIGFKAYSNPEDTLSLQNINIELRQLKLDEISAVLPILPEITGRLSTELHYIQTEENLHLAAEAKMEQLSYNKKQVGDLGLGFAWLPDDENKHFIDAYLTHDQEEVLLTDGMIQFLPDKKEIALNTIFEHLPLKIANVLFENNELALGGDIDGSLSVSGTVDSPLINGELILDSVTLAARQAGAVFRFDNRPVQIKQNKMEFKDFSIFASGKDPFTINGVIDFVNLNEPTANLKLYAKDYTLLDAARTKESLIYGKVIVDINANLSGPIASLKMRGNMSLLNNTDVTYVMTDSPLSVQDRLGELVTFTNFADTLRTIPKDTTALHLDGMDMVLMVQIDPSVQLKVDLSPDRSSRVKLEGGGSLTLQYTPQGDMRLSGRYTLSGGTMKYTLPVIPLKEFNIIDGSYVEWFGDPKDPKLSFKAVERVRAAVAEADGSSHMVNFDISIGVKNRLDNLELVFDLNAPENGNVQNQLAAMGQEERSKQAVALLATGIYLAGGSNSKGGLNMGAALNSVLQSQINSIAGSSLKNASFSMGIEEHDELQTGGKRTDYSFRYAQRFFNNRVQIVLGGRVSTGANATNTVESFIDNISLEYRLDKSGTRYARIFHLKNYEDILEGEVTETGAGLVLRKKMDKLSELFIFRRNKKKNEAKR